MSQPGDCDLLGAFGLLVQGAITLVCACALVAVWVVESPRRPLLTWALDVSKQVAGAAYGKCYNIAQAEVFARLPTASTGQTDQCVWYLMGIATDCLVTTFLCWGATALARPVLASRCGIDIGNYGEVPVLPSPRRSSQLSLASGEGVSRSGSFCSSAGGAPRGSCPAAPGAAGSGGRPPLLQQRPPSAVRPWLVQVGIWLLVITGVRLLVTLGLALGRARLYGLYAGVFDALGLRCPTAKMAFAVLAFPAVGDAFQIVVQDCFLKKGAASVPHGASLDSCVPLLDAPPAAEWARL